MKTAKIQLTRAHLRILRNGDPIIIRLSDAQVEISIHPDARLAFSLDQVLGEMKAVIDKGTGKGTA